MSNLSEILASLTPEQRALFELKLQRLKEQQKKTPQRKAKPESPKIIRRPVTGPVPLSLDQERLWFINEVSPDNAAYNIHTATRLVGELNTNLLEKSLNEIIKRHEALRTSFILQDKQPMQVIVPTVTMKLPVIDLQHLTPAEQEARVNAYVLEEAVRPFDLTQPPLLHSLLLKISDSEHILILIQHHIITDWWSFQLFFQEFATFYDAFVMGQTPRLPEVPFQYTDFVLWERERVEKQDMERSVAYWRKHLAGGTFQLDLPIGNRRPIQQTFAGRHESINLPPELVQELKAFCTAQRATLFMTLTAAFKALLFRYTGQSDITLGGPLANRSHAELEGVFGFLITMLLFHTRLSGDLSFNQLLNEVRKVILEAYAHQDVPFTKVLEAAQVARDWGRNPLFQFSFIFLDEEGAPEGFKSIQSLPLEYDPQVSRFDMTLIVEDHGDKTIAFIEYNSDLFEADSIVRFAGHFQTLLESILAQPDTPIAQLPMLTEPEREQLLVEWNGMRVPYPEQQTLHGLFEAQVIERPDALALLFGNQQLTYQALNQQANQLAHHLQTLGVGPETLVGICVERSALMVVGILGILKAGAAYVPLDPAYPSERLGFMLEDAQITTLLTQQKLLVALPHSIQTLCLDADWSMIAQQSTENVHCPVSSNDLAYLIYTSGSTGKPKGIEIAHRNVLAMLCAYEHLAPRPEILRGTSVCPYGFDVSVWEIFSNLCFGGALHILLPETFASPKLLVDYLIEQEISSAYIPPMLLSDVAAEYEKADWTKKEKYDFPLRRMLVGVEPIKQKVLQRFRNLSGKLHIINGYGPTECAICSTFFAFEQASGPEDRTPIGRALANYQVYIVDSEFQPTPIGIPGELCVAGAGVGRGYYQRPELTKEKFVPNPYGEGRVYRTGDLARYLSDGNIEFVGRIDHQVKVRGYRIELGEIESVLTQHPTVRESVVVAREEAGRKQLVAYVVANEHSDALSIPDLRAHLSGALPDYMVPAAFVQLDSLPLTPNGKVDRKALPAPDAVAFTSESDFALPKTVVEQKLAAIWGKFLTLEAEQIGRHDNFFELGGDSILSLQIVGSANQEGIHLTASQLFEHQTIAALAAAADTSKRSPVQAEQGIVTGSLPLTPIQRWFFEQQAHTQRARGVHHFTLSALLEIAPTIRPAWLEQAIQGLIKHHDALRLRFIPDENGWQQINAPLPEGSGLEMKVQDLSGLSPEEQEATIKATCAELEASLNISEGPLLQAALFDLGADKAARLFFTIHHLAVDLVSWRILVEDLWTVYQQVEHGQALRLPAKTTSFKAWAEWVSDYAQSEALAEEVAYWQAVADAEVAPLAVDYVDADRATENTLASAAEVATSLSVEETQLLLTAVPTVYHTQINDLLLTALAQTFAQWSGENRLLLGLEGHGREELSNTVDLSRTVGWFTTLFPVLLELPAPPSQNWRDSGLRGGEAIKSIKEQLRQVPQRGIGYGLLRYLNPIGEALEVQPDVSFNYGGQFKEVQSDSFGGSSHPDSSLPHLISINGFVYESQLELSWSYSQSLFQRSTIEALAEGFIQALQGLIAHCQLPEAGGYTPSDFPLATLNQGQLDRLVGNGREVTDLYPLSPLQAGLLFHTLYAPGSGVYINQFAFQLEGDLDVVAFKGAWEALVARHPILRTEFHWSGLSAPVQLVRRSVELPWAEADWQHLSADEQATQLQRLLTEERAQGFELTEAPLMRFALIKLEQKRYQFVWSFHHLLLDGWSWPILFKELFTLYAPRPASLPSPIIGRGVGGEGRPYRDYIAWVQQQDMAQAEQFWRDTLAGFTAPTPLLTAGAASNRSERATQAWQEKEEFQLYHFHFSSHFSRAMEKMAREQRLTLNTLVQGAWALLLSRYSGESEVLFGVTVSGRPAALSGVDEMVGMFINTLPMRVNLSEQTLLECLRGLQRQQVTQEEYAYTPLVEIQKWSEVPAGISLFETLVVFENYPIDDSAASLTSGIQLTNFQSFEQSNVPITFVAGAGQQFGGLVNYDRSRFDEATIERLVGHFEQLLTQMVANPAQPLSAFSLLTESERQQLLVEWNDTARPYPAGQCLHQLIEEQVERTPEAVAAVFSSPLPLLPPQNWGGLRGGGEALGVRAQERLTYRQLNRQANQLAHHLQGLGVGPEVMVGLSFERGLDMLVSLLAILKAGGAYVPLDPDYPAERLAFMLADAQLQFVVTQEGLVNQLPDYAGQVICVDSERDLIAQNPIHNPISDVKAEQLAYVIYTSGSTGQPKGVLVTHQGLGNLAQAQIGAFAVTPESRVLQFASLNFDASISEIAMALLSGATLVLASPMDLLPGPPLTRLLREEAISHVTLVPSVLKTLYPEDLPKLQTLIVAGEACSAELANRWSTGRRFLNAYGPTETTVCATIMDHTGITSSQAPPIGRPIDNFQIYILDSQQQPVPIGVPGELHVGGVGLARGYLNRPALTEERFISTNPSSTPGRLYKTGDLARYLPDGKIEFLGRVDHQVKLRGFRIELGEIESLLAQNESVEAAVAIVRDEQLVAYVVPSGQDVESEALISALRTHLKENVPSYMIPGAFVLLERLPLNPNGKINRKALPAPTASGPLSTSRTVGAPAGHDKGARESEGQALGSLAQSKIEREIALIWQEVLGLSLVGVHDNFFDLGGHSLLILQVHNKLHEQLGYELAMVDLFQYPTIASLAKYLTQSTVEQPLASSDVSQREQSDEIAIISMGGRFPGANDIETFWENLREGVEGITHFSDEQLLAAGVDPELLAHPNYVKASSILEDIDLFDASFFGFYPREAEMLNPQQRFFLECAWETLEKAGYNPDHYAKPIGVYAGCSLNDYIMGLDPAQHADILEDSYQLWLGNDNNFLATQVAYKLNLKGPSLTVQTACSTSLVAVHVACQSLLNRECDMALAGGVTIQINQTGYMSQPGSIFSPDGHTRTFDAQAAGTVGGSGVGIVLLKRLSDAQADGDHILAVIKGSAINNDGAMKVGFTAPSVEGQANVITEALSKANVSPESISYIEAHGTGTVLGDPIEIAALTQAFRPSPPAPLPQGEGRKVGYCKIGSVKSNVGHLDSAAGVTGLIKTVLALHHRQIPPSLHYTEANPQIDFAASPFQVNTQLSNWSVNGHPRRAGVSSFGIGGTNAHVILEEAPSAKGRDAAAEERDGTPSNASRAWQLLPLSAKSASALDQMTINLGEHLALTPSPSPNNRRGELDGRGEIRLADVAYTLQVGRKRFEHRRVIVCRNAQGDSTELWETIAPLIRNPQSAIRNPQSAMPLLSAQESSQNRAVLFMFPGQGTQYVNMAQELYQSESLFRQTVDQCAELLEPELGLDLRDLLYPKADQASSASEQLKQTAYSQPALFVIEYALARLWMSWGVQPQAMIGHSLGEYVAATLAGVFSLEDALKLVAIRGRLMQSMPSGSMLGILRPAAEIESLISEYQGEYQAPTLAAINSPTQCVVSGEHQVIEQFAHQLDEQGIDYRRLHTSHAFHSAMMEPILAPFTHEVEQISLQPPQIPFISNVSGTWIMAAEATDPTYWARHLRQPVRFAEGLQTLLTEPESALLEVGPGRTLSGLVKQQYPKGTLSNQPPSQPLLTSLPAAAAADEQPALPYLLTTLGRLWLSGVEIDWAGFYHTNNQEKRDRVPLPTYPFERQRYWLERDRKPSAPSASQKRAALEEWFYAPSWKRAVTPKVADLTDSQNWLIFSEVTSLLPSEGSAASEGAALGESLVHQLETAGQIVVTVTPGEAFGRVASNHYTINPQETDDYEVLFETLQAHGKLPQQICHLWLVPSGNNGRRESGQWEERLANVRALGFDSLLSMAQALGRHTLNQPIKLAIVTSQLVQVAGDEALAPEKATILGPSLVIPQEYPTISTLNIDLPSLSGLEAPQITRLVNQLIADVSESQPEAAPLGQVMAYRGRHRWLQTYEPTQLLLPPSNGTGRQPLPALLRQGGTYLITGGLGGIGLTLAEYLAQTVQANLILTSRSAPGGSHSNHQATQNMQANGSEVLVLPADVADESQMAAAIAQAKARFGQIDGVIHAAGVPDGGIMQLKTAEAVTAVWHPKVQGTWLLDTLLSENPPDFMLTCSSLASVVGSVGQVAYCAANAFQDAFAHYRSNHPTNPYPVISINWDTWQEVGMAVEAAKKPSLAHSRREGRAVAHPLFDECLVEESNRTVYVSRFEAAKDWLLDEHRIMGQATLPGTGYLELVRAAFSEQGSISKEHAANGAKAIQIQDVSLMSPLVVADDEEKEVHTILTKQGEQVEFSIVSRVGEGSWLEHARGVISTNGTNGRYVQHDLQALKAGAGQEISLPPRGAIPTKEESQGVGKVSEAQALVTGPRFDTLKRVQINNNQGLAYLELAAEFADDLESYLLHPTLMDAATAFVTLPTVSSAVPMGYDKLTIYGPLPRKIYSYARYASGYPAQSNDGAQSNILKIDVTIMDEAGQERVAIEGFTLMQIGLDSLATPQKPSEAPSELELKDRALRATPPAYGIRPSEGATVLAHVLNHDLPQVLVSTIDLSSQISRVRPNADLPSANHGRGAGDQRKEGQGYARPSLSSAYVAPTNESEQLIAELWQALLGIEQIGIHDDFFELGGHSLLATRLMAQLGERFDRKISLATLFQAPTVAQLAAELSVKAKDSRQLWSPAVPMHPTTGVTADKPAFFCLPGSGGHVLYLWELARHASAGSDQRFYGLQPPGLEDDHTPPLNRMDDIIDYFINVLQDIQPTGPYLLGGHSAGGHIAFALALALQKRGIEVPLVTLFDTASYRDIRENMEVLAEQVLRNLGDYVQALKNRLGDRLSLSTSDIEKLDDPNPDEEAIHAVAQAYKDANLLPDDGGVEHLQRIEALDKATTEALNEYDPDGIYEGQLLILRAEENELNNAERMIAGWQPLCRKPVQLETVPGNHLTILMSPNVELMARHLRAALDGVQRNGD